jgi:hypothetical protein
MKTAPGEIDISLARRIFKEAYDMGIRHVGLSPSGEMFLCRDITRHIQNAKETGFTYIYSDTNGVLATHENLKNAIEAGLDSIKFSINAGIRETYRKIHGRDDFEVVMRNLQTCFELKERMNSQMNIFVSFVAMCENEHEIEILREQTKPFTDEFWIYPVATCFLENKEEADFMKSKRYAQNTHLIPCPMVFERIHVTCEGYYSACCSDFDRDLILADLNRVSLDEALNSTAAINFRNAMSEK